MVLWAVLPVLAAGGMAYCGESDPSGRVKVGAETGSISAERTDKGSPGEPLKTLTEGGSVHEDKKEANIRVSNPTIPKEKKPVSPQTQQSPKLPSAEVGENDEEWVCSDEILNRSGTLDRGRCPEKGRPYACYEEVRETCVEKKTGRKKVKEYTRYTGRCGATYSDCW